MTDDGNSRVNFNSGFRYSSAPDACRDRVTASYDKTAAVVVLPPVGGGRLQNPELIEWLARADLSRISAPQERLSTILTEIGEADSPDGLAALRMWGQTGDRPTAWIAAADPIYLEPRLDHLRLHALRRSGITPAELRPLIDHLQRTLAGDAQLGFARMGSYGYITAQQAIATADLPAYAIDRLSPEDYLPVGDGADRHRGLLSEIEMALHDHQINLKRQANGGLPINSLWIWGGGFASEKRTEVLPPLFSDDPLLSGYWEARTGLAEEWPGSISRCVDVAVAGFVAMTPEFDDGTSALETPLKELRALLTSGRVSGLTLLFRDGVRAQLRRSHGVRIWRRGHPLLR